MSVAKYNDKEKNNLKKVMEEKKFWIQEKCSTNCFLVFRSGNRPEPKVAVAVGVSGSNPWWCQYGFRIFFLGYFNHIAYSLSYCW